MDRRKRSENKEYKNPKTRERKKRVREKRRKRRTFGPYILIFILLSASIFFGVRSLSHNVERISCFFLRFFLQICRLKLRLRLWHKLSARKTSFFCR